ncbi:hypothetical protein Hanom_Chr01g00065011 [Helianthus anomalus]
MSKMPFSSLSFGQFCDFRPKVCFIRLVNSIHFSLLSQVHFRLFCQLKGQFSLM